MNGGDGKDYVGTSWPGVSARLLGTADNGNKVFKWTSAKSAAPDMIIFSGGGSQTSDMPFVNGGYYTNDGRQAVVTGISTTLNDQVKTAGQNVYDLGGRRVSPSAVRRGLYIVNGRKVVK
jgi:alpha-amylase